VTGTEGDLGDRVEIDVASLKPMGTYPWLTATVIPRPIAWVSSQSADGVDNLAPHSFFTVASAEPPVISFTSVGSKDSLRNIRETEEFVVCLTPRAWAASVNVTGTNFPAEASEFDVAGLTPEPSAAVTPWRVAQSPVALECRLAGERSFGRSTVVFGAVVHVAVARNTLAADGYPDPRLLDPASRLGRDEWAALGEVFRLRRMSYAEWSTQDPGGGSQ
jgi:flavin reductase (DIM6/NTAB) family NADH-FMN oxidoreductase RutF